MPVLVLALSLLAGCASGPINPPPCVRKPATASWVTVRREMSVVGAPATLFFVIEDERVYALQIGQSYSFRIDSGEHRMGYDLGFNKCRQRVRFKPNHDYLIVLTPVCDIEPKDLSETCPTR